MLNRIIQRIFDNVLAKEGQQLALIRKLNTLLIRKRSNLHH